MSFIKQYDGGDCFYVAPTLVAENTANIEGFGSSVAPFELLDFDFKRAHGFEASIGLHQVTPPQCAAVTFLARMRNEPGRQPRLDVNASSLQNGIAGAVSEFGDRYVELLVVADDGTVFNVSPRLRRGADSQSFVLGPQSYFRPGRPLLLLAVASINPLEAWHSPTPGKAEEVFPRALKEARDTGQALNVAAKYVKLDK
jgi:hypothetical protein